MVAVGHVYVALLCSCMSNCTLPKYTSSNQATTKEVDHAWEQHGALTLVKQTGLWGSDIKLTKLWWSKCTRVASNVSNVFNTSCIREEKPRLTLIAEWAEEAGEALAVTGDVVTGAVTVDTLRTRLAAVLAEEAWWACCRHTHTDIHTHC